MKYVSRAWGELKRGFEVLAMGETCFGGMGGVEKGLRGVGTGCEMRFEGMGAVEKGV